MSPSGDGVDAAPAKAGSRANNLMSRCIYVPGGGADGPEGVALFSGTGELLLLISRGTAGIKLD